MRFMVWCSLLALSACHAQDDLGHVVTVEKQNLPAGTVFIQRAAGMQQRVEISAVLFSEKAVTLRVLDQPSRANALFLPQLLQTAGAFAGCNGGYFKAMSFEVYGLQVSDGLAQGSVGEVSPLETALLVRDGRIGIERAQGLQDLASISQMVQCSPILVDRGSVAYASREEEPQVNRTFAATDGHGLWLIGCCKRTTLTKLARVLANHGIFPEIKIETAMNLDGGPSSGLWCRTLSGDQREFHQGTPVRNCIALFPRKD